MKSFLFIFSLSLFSLTAEEKLPNIIMMMCDDLGWGDTGFNGNKTIKTPELDSLATQGVNMKHFYAGGPVCSPTRGTCLTGRHYWRYGIWFANKGHLPKEEITVAQILKEKGYATGHFGKWHLGTLSKTISAKGKARKPEANFAPPWERFYDRSFVTESAISTWDPGYGKRAKNNPFYDDGKPTMDNVKGGAAKVVMDRAIPFIEKAVAEKKPFLSVIWFHAPHEDIQAGPEYLKMYEGHGEAAHYFGCITELDEQVGRLQKKLKELGVYENTLQFFTSDNGPEGGEPKNNKTRRAGTTGGFKGRKRALYDGGVRVPSLVIWPGKVKAGTEIKTAASTLDYLPTIAKIVAYDMPDSRPIDGMDMMPIVLGESTSRAKSIPLRTQNLAGIVKGNYKLLTQSLNSSKDELYDLSKDWKESNNIASSNPELIAELKKELKAFLESAEKSHSGADYGSSNYEPVEKFQKLK